MYNMSYLIEIQDDSGNYIPAPLIEEISIERSIKNLADFATITAPIFHMNKIIKYKEKIRDKLEDVDSLYKLYKRGQRIRIHLGYNDILRTEFIGYIREVKTNDGVMKIECEDELFIFRNKKMPDIQLKNISVKGILNFVIGKVNKKIKIKCDYDMVYESFAIHKATGFDVLMQLQQDTGADVYFMSYYAGNIGNTLSIEDVNGIKVIEEDINPKFEKIDRDLKELHFRMPYDKNNRIKVKTDFSMQHNVESSSLEFIDTTDRKVKVKIVTSSIKGGVKEIEFGNTGGEEFEFKVNRISEADMKKRAKAEFDRLMQPGYQGSFNCWLIPFVEPNDSIGIYDKDFPEKDGIYNVESIKVSFSSNGGVRTITPGFKLSK